MASASPMFCDAPVTTARASALGAGTGMGRDYIVGQHERTAVVRAGRARSQVLSWALWDFGSTGLNAVVVTFVFSIYLTNAVGDGSARRHQPDQLARVGAGRRRSGRSRCWPR